MSQPFPEQFRNICLRCNRPMSAYVTFEANGRIQIGGNEAAKKWLAQAMQALIDKQPKIVEAGVQKPIIVQGGNLEDPKVPAPEVPGSVPESPKA